MKLNLKDNFVLKIISVVIAIILWIAVQTSVNPQIEWKIREEVDFTNHKVLQNRNLYIVNKDKYSVDVKVKGSLIDLMLRKSDDCKVKCDVNSVNIAGEYDDLSFTCASVSGKLKYEIVSSKENLIVDIRNIKTAEKEIKIETEGSVKEGSYTSKKHMKTESKTITVKGVESDVEAVSGGKVSVKLNGRDSDFSEKLPIVFYDSHGEEFEPEFPDMFEPKSGAGVRVDVEVFVKKNVKIEVKGISEDVETEIIPSEIEVYGKKEAIENLGGKITVNDFRLSSKEEGHKQELNLKLSDDVYLTDEKIVPVLKVNGEKNEEDN